MLPPWPCPRSHVTEPFTTRSSSAVPGFSTSMSTGLTSATHGLLLLNQMVCWPDLPDSGFGLTFTMRSMLFADLGIEVAAQQFDEDGLEDVWHFVGPDLLQPDLTPLVHGNQPTLFVGQADADDIVIVKPVKLADQGRTAFYSALADYLYIGGRITKMNRAQRPFAN